MGTAKDSVLLETLRLCAVTCCYLILNYLNKIKVCSNRTLCNGLGVGSLGWCGGPIVSEGASFFSLVDRPPLVSCPYLHGPTWLPTTLWSF